ncbi:MAG: acyl-CoA thioesterase domain-containing protein, partial [Enterobacteriaceae bacterium]
MNPQLTSLLDLLCLQQTDDDCYQGQNQNLGLPQVFGGQLIGQALYAAKQSMPAERQIHSFHCYFLRPASSDIPITYHVDNLRDGHSFSTRQIRAQQQQELLMEMTASFQRPEQGFEHQS